jgi:hypothetical protein
MVVAPNQDPFKYCDMLGCLVRCILVFLLVVVASCH